MPYREKHNCKDEIYNRHKPVVEPPRHGLTYEEARKAAIARKREVKLKTERLELMLQMAREQDGE